MIMVSRFGVVLGGWLVDASESSSPSKSAQSLPGQPGASENSVHLRACKLIIINYAELGPFTLQ